MAGTTGKNRERPEGGERKRARELFAFVMSISALAPPARDFYLGLRRVAGGEGVFAGEVLGDLFPGERVVPAGFLSGEEDSSLDFAFFPLSALAFYTEEDEWKRFFSSVSSALKEGGRLAFDLENHGRAAHENSVTRTAGEARRGGEAAVYSYSKTLLPDGKSVFWRIGVETLSEVGEVTSKSYRTLTLGRAEPEKLARLAREAGFFVEALFGDFYAARFEDSSPLQVWILRKGREG